MKRIENKKILKRFLESDYYKHYFPNKLKKYAFLIELDSGEDLLKQGDKLEYLYCLMSGKCIIHTYLNNGKRIILASSYPGSLIGEIELLENKDAGFSVKCLEETIIMCFPLDKCRDILINDNHFLRSLCIDLAYKENRNAKKLIMTSGFSLENRLAEFILNNNEEDIFKIRKVEIAETLGVSYRHLSKVLKEFVLKKYLRKEKFNYYLINKKALNNLASILKDY